MPVPRLLLVVGLQKSGTTPLARLLQATGAVASPFRAEGDEWWGNVPPFAPEAFPAGEVYRRTGGADGHEIGAADATDAVRAHLLAALPRGETRPILNKNPYNVVRLRWLRALFPDATIVAMARRPVPNVYSLTKKFVPHEGRGQPPDGHGWWGVKPRGWRDLVGEDKAVQCARQWRAVNECLARDRDAVDLVLSYHRLCAEPAACLREVLTRATGRPYTAPIDAAPIRCFDDEFARGARARSKNRYFAETRSLATPEDEDAEVPPLADADVRAIEATCADVERRFPELA